MKKANRKVKIELEIDVPTITSNDGTKFNITKSQLISAAKLGLHRDIDDKVLSKVSKCKKIDEEHQFDSFKVDLTDLVYDESNPETYKHFVYHYLKEYYVDSRDSNHYQNGGHWHHSRYTTDINLHTVMLKEDSTIYTVRDLLIKHLTSANTCRMYGSGQYNRRVRKLVDIEDVKKFWKFVFDHKILDINGVLEYSAFHNDESERVKTVAEYVILKCFRDNAIELLTWLIEEYGLDLYKAELCHKDGIIEHEGYRLSFLCALLEDCHTRDIHDTYNNGVSVRLRDYDGSRLTKGTWMDKHCNSLAYIIGLIHNKYPKLKVIDNSFDTKEKGENKKLMSWVNDNLLDEYLDSDEKGEVESAKDLLKRIKAQIKSQSV